MGALSQDPRGGLCPQLSNTRCPTRTQGPAAAAEDSLKAPGETGAPRLTPALSGGPEIWTTGHASWSRGCNWLPSRCAHF